MKRRSLVLIALSVALVTFTAPAAVADLGVERVSRTSGKPGANVKVTVGCRACAATGAKHVASFPVSLVPIDEVPRPHRCGSNKLCPPRVRAVPRQAPFSYLGQALPPRGGGGIDKSYPRYILDFTIPILPAGTYAYVIYCDVCADGKGGSLIAEPNLDRWRLRIRAR